MSFSYFEFQMLSNPICFQKRKELYSSSQSLEYKATVITILVFFQNEVIFVQLDELDDLDRIINAWIGFNYSLTKTQKTSSVMVSVADN